VKRARVDWAAGNFARDGKGGVVPKGEDGNQVKESHTWVMRYTGVARGGVQGCWGRFGNVANPREVGFPYQNFGVGDGEVCSVGARDWGPPYWVLYKLQEYRVFRKFNHEWNLALCLGGGF